ncbi:hypothetical protein Pmar_PMAR018470 [Perkinsus marinus ATCC 50983]|uniref:Uncharacterized protein n=1 Tax=Perkinsus marinus (strain ATCC 50983 / TXsc) TaxID=423536 RepID=C5KZX1_PERM5|nr:hypothetical protein Pmar_PMAR018470 [Perkinsus marinus ATCC 50983]EER09829.1 hypothetical protein Pmar_PMAR018470 [Perkinsus marinus ATCC 50983]|eukprot:XP_002778034.1 hypothetical protein Pmar_PMAR018470 [Perkinsus marinus ATCC 50983]
MATAPALAAARLDALHGLLGDMCDDLVDPIWNYLPPTYPNGCTHIKGTRLPDAFAPLEFDLIDSVEPTEMLGMIGPSTVVVASLQGGPQVGPHPLLGGFGIDPARQIPMNDASQKSPEVVCHLEGVLQHGCLVNGQLYYTLMDDPIHLLRRPVLRGPSAPAIMELPEQCRQLKPVKDCLFLVGMETDWLYMLSPKSREFKKVLRLSRDLDRLIIWDDEDEWDPGFIIPDPVFQDAILEKGRPTHVLYTKGNSKRGALSLEESDDWTAHIAIRGRREAVRGNRVTYCAGYSVMKLRHYVRYTRHEDHGFHMEYIEEEERELYGSDYDSEESDF